MRQQLLEVLAGQRESVPASIAALMAAGEDWQAGLAASSAATALPADFCYNTLRGELFIQRVFVRVYNEQPGFKLSDPVAFAKGLLNYLAAAMREVNGPKDVPEEGTQASEVHARTLHPIPS